MFARTPGPRIHNRFGVAGLSDELDRCLGPRALPVPVQAATMPLRGCSGSAKIQRILVCTPIRPGRLTGIDPDTMIISDSIENLDQPIEPGCFNMTEKTTEKTLDESRALFIRRWGEMSSYWGISRTMAEIHALLYLSTEPVCTDDVMGLLLISRGNASMSLRSLVDWGLIERVHLRGDRKEYFTALTDVWKLFETIARQRRRREVEPIIDTIHRCREMVNQDPAERDGADSGGTKVYLRRLDEMQSFLQAFGTVVDLLMKVGPKGLKHVSGVMRKIAR